MPSRHKGLQPFFDLDVALTQSRLQTIKNVDPRLPFRFKACLDKKQLFPKFQDCEYGDDIESIVASMLFSAQREFGPK